MDKSGLLLVCRLDTFPKGGVLSQSTAVTIRRMREGVTNKVGCTSRKEGTERIGACAGPFLGLPPLAALLSQSPSWVLSHGARVPAVTNPDPPVAMVHGVYLALKMEGLSWELQHFKSFVGNNLQWLNIK